MAWVNDWDDPAKLLWLQVRLTGKAQTAWNRLRDEDKQDYARGKLVLQHRFEPDSCRDLYAAEFQVRCHWQGEMWGCLADNLRRLADKGFLELDNRAKEQLSLDRFLSLIEDPDAALAVHQRRPKDLNEAVACVLEIKAYLALGPRSQKKVSSIQQSPGDMEVVSAIQSSQNTIIQMLNALTTRVDKLEGIISASGSVAANSDREALRNRSANLSSCDQQSTWKQRNRSDFGEPVCRRCGREGHFARGCAARIPTGLGAPPNQAGEQRNTSNSRSSNVNVYTCDNNETCKLLAVNPAHAYHVTEMIDGIDI